MTAVGRRAQACNHRMAKQSIAAKIFSLRHQIYSDIYALEQPAVLNILQSISESCFFQRTFFRAASRFTGIQHTGALGQARPRRQA